MDSPERAALLENVRAIIPAIVACSDSIDQNRAIPDDIIARLAAAGVFRMSVARDHGGLELDPLTNFEVIEELAKADASVAWVCMISSAVAWGVSGVMSDELASELFPRDPTMILAGFNAMCGVATLCEGGCRLTGRWPFGSGIRHSKYMAICAAAADENGFRKRPNGDSEPITMLVPTKSLEIIDTWNTTGMRGTGSHDYTASDLFVPSRYRYPIWEPQRRENPMYRYPAFYLFNMAAVPLGVAASALAAVREGKGPFRADFLLTGGPGNDPFKNRWLAEAHAIVASARAFVLDVGREAWRALASGRDLSLSERATFRIALTHAFQACSDAVLRLFDAFGSSAFYTANPIERHMRDMQTMRQHGGVSLRSYGRPGQMLLGHDPKHLLY